MLKIRSYYILPQVSPRPQDKGRSRNGFLLATAIAAMATPAIGCDIALALAVDVSGSVDSEEYRIQMHGLADALRDGTVADALVRAKARVMLVEWTGESRQYLSIPWTDIATYDDVVSLANAVDLAPRAWQHFSTAIGSALGYTTALFNGNEGCRRKVIDISGDGASNEGVDPATLRSELWAQSFTVNALVIEGSEPDLTSYFWEHVIAGENAFVMTANGFADYPAKIKLKLLRELTEQVSAVQPRRQPG